jgi:hypothetical protein
MCELAARAEMVRDSDFAAPASTRAGSGVTCLRNYQRRSADHRTTDPRDSRRKSLSVSTRSRTLSSADKPSVPAAVEDSDVGPERGPRSTKFAAVLNR